MTDFGKSNAFDAYCWAHGMTNAVIAKDLRVTTEMVRRLRLPLDHADYLRPSARKMVDIYRLTAGRVEPNHWFDLSADAPMPEAEVSE